VLPFGAAPLSTALGDRWFAQLSAGENGSTGSPGAGEPVYFARLRVHEFDESGLPDERHAD
jgi:hypothetical protein